MRLYAVSRDGTLAGIVWRVGMPMMVGSPETARKERGRALADPKMSAGWVILAVDVTVVGVVAEPPPPPANEQAPARAPEGGGT